MLKESKIAQKGPYEVEVEPGRYSWCSCGLSENQPFCDGSHSGTDFNPVEYKSEIDKLVGFCGCKITKKQPLCDGSHKTIGT